jgi:phage shock protein PspC (stress-responsive transcriptional regulator)
MKKTVSINLNSFVFVIDEDAYNMLHLYLGKLEDHFSKIEEGSEIVRDIESRIVEIFSSKINEGKQVINIRDVEEIIQILGNVDDITGDEHNEKSTTESEDKTKENKKSKKFYRDPDSRVLGGVCSGLAEYTGISTTFWRIIFLIFIFIGQISIIAYLILWIAVPEAKTTAQKLEMKGDKINLTNIEKTVKKEFDEVKKNFRKIDKSRFSDVINNIGKAIVTVITVFAQIFGKVLGIVFILSGAAVLILLTIALFSVGKENMFYSNDFINMIWLPGLLEYVTNSGTAWLLSICILIVFIIPVIAIISWGIGLLFEIKSNKYLSVGTFVLWIIAIVFSIALSINIAASFRSIETKTHTEIIQTDSLKTYHFTINPEIKDVCILPDKIDNFNDLNLVINSKFFLLKNGNIQYYPHIYFNPTKDSIASMEIKYYARGANNREAKENLKLIDYKYICDTNNVYFNPYFQINANKWRAQDIKITVNIPVDSKIIIDKSLSWLIDIDDISGELSEDEMCDKEIFVTDAGFTIK